MRRQFLALAALAAFVAVGSSLAPVGSWASLRPAPVEPVPAPVEPVEYAAPIARAYVFAVERPGEPGEYDAADYGLPLGECFDRLRALPQGVNAYCEADRG